MNTYYYSGPVMQFNTCLHEKWRASTQAVSEKKARSNLEYRFKKEYDMEPYSKVSLTGKIRMDVNRNV